MTNDKDIAKIQPVTEYIVIARRHMERSDAVPSGPPIWLISFTDVIALMLTFFVLMYAMSDPEPEKWDKKIGITAQATAQFSGARNEAGNAEGVNLNSMDYVAAENLDYLQALFSEIANDSKATQIMTIARRGNVLNLQFDNVYEKNSNEFNSDFLLFLNALIPLLQSLDNQISLVYAGDDIRILQNAGQALGRDGYSKPLILQLRDQSDSDSSGRDFVISLLPHNGRRITR